jgi:hypothetical protein
MGGRGGIKENDALRGVNLTMITWYIIRTFVNPTMYPHPEQQLKRKKKENNSIYSNIK